MSWWQCWRPVTVYRLVRGRSVRSLNVSPDGRHLAVLGNHRAEAPGVLQSLFDLWVVAIPSPSELS